MVAVLACAAAVIAWRSAGDGLTLAPESRIWVEGTSTVRSFKCSSTGMQATVDAAADAIRAVLAGEKAVTAVSLTVPDKSLDCGNGTMNEHMLNALNEKAHPAIAFRLVSYELAAADTGRAGSLSGVLTINGADQQVSFPVQLREGAAGALRVTGKYALNMRDYGIKPPTLMLGTMKVGEKVTVNFDLLLKSGMGE